MKIGDVERTLSFGVEKSYTLDYVIGARCDVNGGIGVLNEKEIVFAAAKRVVIHDVESHSQRYISTEHDVSCIAINQSRTLLGVAEKGSNAVELYDVATLRCKTKLVHLAPTCDNQHISFSKDSSVILTLTLKPECAMTMWKMNKQKADVAATLKLSTVLGDVLRADICPTNINLISVLGKTELRMFRPSTKMNSRFIPLSLGLDSESHHFTTQCWLQSGDLVVATANGKVLVIGEERNLKQVIDTVTTAVRSIMGCPKGFAAGCSDGSFVTFLRANKEDVYAASKRLNLLQEKIAVTALGLMRSVSTTGASLFTVICLMETNQIVRFPLHDYDTYSMSTVIPSLNNSISSVTSLVPSFGSLLMDCCAWLPLVAIGGYDGTLRLYDFNTKKVKHSHHFGEPISSVSFHPCGKYVLVSTSKMVSLCSIQHHKLSVLWQVDDLPNISTVRFSRGGDMFGIALNSVLQIHDFYTSDFANVSTLRSHSKAIVAFDFNSHRDELCTVGADSVVCLWEIRKGQAIKRINLPSPAAYSGCVDWNERVAYVMTVDCFLKKVSLDEGIVVVETKIDRGDRLLTVLPSGKLLVSSDDGTANLLSFSDDSLVTEHLCSHERVTCAACTDTIIFVAGGGCVAIYSTKSVGHPVYSPTNSVILCDRVDLDETNSKIQGLERTLETLKDKHCALLASMKSKADHEKAQFMDAYQQRADAFNEESTSLLKDIDVMKTELKLALDDIEKQHSVQLECTNEASEKRRVKERDHTNEFVKRCDDQRRSFEAEMVKLEESNAQVLSKEAKEFHQTMIEENKMCELIINNIEAARVLVKEHEQKMDDDAEREIADLLLAHHAEIKNLKRSNQLLLNEKQILQQRYESMLDDLKELEEQISLQEESHKEIQAIIEGLDANILAHQLAITEKNDHIFQTEQKMSSYSQSNLEEEARNCDIVNERTRIENDTKPHQVKVELRLSESSQLSDQIRHDQNTLSYLDVELDNLKIKLKQSKQHIASMAATCSEKDAIISSLEAKLLSNKDSALSYLDHHLSLKASLKCIFEEFLGDKPRKQSSVKTCHEKLISIEKKMSTLKKATEQKRKTHAKDMSRLMREYNVLVKELEDTKENSSAQFQTCVLNDTSNIIAKQSTTIANIELKALTGKSTYAKDI